ncbi:MAG: LPXTG cell wall anchor domain-containing protein [Muribaculum sp.]|nr:LPXTG cell wall anchor domain-containing protein [Muribaculum sp.]
MEIKSNKQTITGRRIMLVAGYITLACSLYWLYRIIFKNDAQWLSFVMTAIVSGALFFFAKKRK